MEYKGNIREGIFVARPNRFIAHVSIGSDVVIAHVKNTGRLKELLKPGVRVLLEHAPHPNRKTDYSLVAVYKEESLINIDSQIPNQAMKEALGSKTLQGFKDVTQFKAESTFGKSRFDFYFERGDRKGYMEVKGVTLLDGLIARFPDAPTERGEKHVLELIQAVQQGYEAAIVFLIQLEDVASFEPNAQMDPKFAEAVKTASAAGVQILAYRCKVWPEGMSVLDPVPVCL